MLYKNSARSTVITKYQIKLESTSTNEVNFRMQFFGTEFDLEVRKANCCFFNSPKYFFVRMYRELIPLTCVIDSFEITYKIMSPHTTLLNRISVSAPKIQGCEISSHISQMSLDLGPSRQSKVGLVKISILYISY